MVMGVKAQVVGAALKPRLNGGALCAKMWRARHSDDPGHTVLMRAQVVAQSSWQAGLNRFQLFLWFSKTGLNSWIQK
jgi:hypothetical protein